MNIVEPSGIQKYDAIKKNLNPGYLGTENNEITENMYVNQDLKFATKKIDELQKIVHRTTVSLR